jgi:hypothetical protein
MSDDVAPPGDEAPLGRTYALVIACHLTVIALLWWFGRTFSS